MYSFFILIINMRILTNVQCYDTIVVGVKEEYSEMKKNSAFLVFVFSTMIFFIMSADASADQFPDLPHWDKGEIMYLYDQGVVKGLPNGRFGSDNDISRGDAALMLARAKELDVNNINKQTFSDVKSDMYFYEAIEMAVSEGYLSGYPDGRFAPKDPLTREQMAKILSIAFNLKGGDESFFNDISTSWAKKEIASLAKNDISNGYYESETRTIAFEPKSNITRAEFSAMLARAMNDEFKAGTGSVYGNIAYQSRFLIGNQADVGAKVFLFPLLLNSNIISKAELDGYSMGLESFIPKNSKLYLAKVDKLGRYEINDVPVSGTYIMVISSENTYRDYNQPISVERLLGNVLGDSYEIFKTFNLELNKHAVKLINIEKNKIIEINYNFGYTFFD